MLTWSSYLTTHASSYDSKLLIYCADNFHSCKETYIGLDSWLVFSLTELAAGVFLDFSPVGPLNRPHNGQPIANGWRAVVVAHKADESYIKRAYGLNRSWVSDLVCWYCRASKKSDSEYLYTCHGPHAKHRETMTSTSEFITNMASPDNPWVRLPGWDIQVLMSDWLHLVDLSLAPDACASVTCIIA